MIFRGRRRHTSRLRGWRGGMALIRGRGRRPSITIISSAFFEMLFQKGRCSMLSDARPVKLYWVVQRRLEQAAAVRAHSRKQHAPAGYWCAGLPAEVIAGIPAKYVARRSRSPVAKTPVEYAEIIRLGLYK
jgi:hypothetical protein